MPCDACSPGSPCTARPTSWQTAIPWDLPRAGPHPLPWSTVSPLSPGQAHPLHPVLTTSVGGLLFQNTQCIPNGLAAYYAEQDPHSPDKFYAVVNHYNLAKQSIARSVSPWMSVLSEEKLSEQETEAAEKSA